MHTVILMTHIVLLSLSLLLTTGLAAISLFGKTAPRLVRQLNLIATAIGVTLGAILLIDEPVGSHCLALTGYIVAFSTIYRFTEKHARAIAAQTAVRNVS